MCFLSTTFPSRDSRTNLSESELMLCFLGLVACIIRLGFHFFPVSLCLSVLPQQLRHFLHPILERMNVRPGRFWREQKTESIFCFPSPSRPAPPGSAWWSFTLSGSELKRHSICDYSRNASKPRLFLSCVCFIHYRPFFDRNVKPVTRSESYWNKVCQVLMWYDPSTNFSLDFFHIYKWSMIECRKVSSDRVRKIAILWRFFIIYHFSLLDWIFRNIFLSIITKDPRPSQEWLTKVMMDAAECCSTTKNAFPDFQSSILTTLSLQSPGSSSSETSDYQQSVSSPTNELDPQNGKIHIRSNLKSNFQQGKIF